MRWRASQRCIVQCSVVPYGNARHRSATQCLRQRIRCERTLTVVCRFITTLLYMLLSYIIVHARKLHLNDFMDIFVPRCTSEFHRTLFYLSKWELYRPIASSSCSMIWYLGLYCNVNYVQVVTILAESTTLDAEKLEENARVQLEGTNIDDAIRAINHHCWSGQTWEADWHDCGDWRPARAPSSIIMLCVILTNDIIDISLITASDWDVSNE